MGDLSARPSVARVLQLWTAAAVTRGGAAAPGNTIELTVTVPCFGSVLWCIRYAYADVCPTTVTNESESSHDQPVATLFHYPPPRAALRRAGSAAFSQDSARTAGNERIRVL